MIIKLLLAVVLGGIIGLERGWRKQPAGLRTHIVVCLGSTLIMLVSLKMKMFSQADPSRIASQVVAGMGFLGAGAIIKYGASVRGLTTAACLWLVAAVGLAIGASMYQEAIVVTLLAFLTINLLSRLESFIKIKKGRRK